MSANRTLNFGHWICDTSPRFNFPLFYSLIAAGLLLSTSPYDVDDGCIAEDRFNRQRRSVISLHCFQLSAFASIMYSNFTIDTTTVSFGLRQSFRYRYSSAIVHLVYCKLVVAVVGTDMVPPAFMSNG